MIFNRPIYNAGDFARECEQKLWALAKSKKPYWKVRFSHQLDDYINDIVNSHLTDVEKIAIVNHWVDSGLPLEIGFYFWDKFHKHLGDATLDLFQKQNWYDCKGMLRDQIKQKP
jgi:hypothetical protein